MKKNLMQIVALVLCGLCFTTNVSAAASDFTSITAKSWNPNMELLTPSNTQTYDLYTSASTIKGSNSFVYFSYMQSLPSAFASSNDRLMHISLYEDDPSGNADELVKIYEYEFRGRKPDGVTVTTINSGNIDSSGDQKGEFYLQFVLYEVPEDDCYGEPTGNFIKYEIATK